MRRCFFLTLLLASLAGCAALHPANPTPSAAACSAWSATSEAFGLAAAAAQAELEQRRLVACQPPAEPGPAEPLPPAPSVPSPAPLPPGSMPGRKD